MYGASLGIMIVRRDLFKRIDTTFIGGGMVDDVDKDSFKLSAESKEHSYTKFESGLQAWGEICALNAAIKWLNKVPKSAKKALRAHEERLFEYLNDNPKIHLINKEPSPTISFYIEGLDSHLAGSALSIAGIMARTGYFCVHYYLDHKMHYPPLIRFSLGYHIRESDIDKTIETLERMTK
jgi:cysteine desulfurase/selenocysteine lyase